MVVLEKSCTGTGAGGSWKSDPDASSFDDERAGWATGGDSVAEEARFEEEGSEES